MQKRANKARPAIINWMMAVLLVFSVGGSVIEAAGSAEATSSEQSAMGLVKRPREMDALLGKRRVNC